MIECESLWTVKDVAEYLGMSQSFVRQARDHMKLPYIQLGAKIRFNPETVRKWATDLEQTKDFCWDEAVEYIERHEAEGGPLPKVESGSGYRAKDITWTRVPKNFTVKLHTSDPTGAVTFDGATTTTIDGMILSTPEGAKTIDLRDLYPKDEVS